MPLRSKMRSLPAFAVAFATGMAAASTHAGTFQVTQIGDSGNGSLRKAILDANAAAGADTIQFNLGPIASPPVYLNLLSSLPTITGDVTITGPGASQVFIGPDPSVVNQSFSLFVISGSPTVEIRGLTITNGSSTDGAAIRAVAGTLTVRECSIYQNNVTGNGGAVSISGAGNCTLNITDSSIASNNAANLGGGIAVVRSSGIATVNLSGATLGRNSTTGQGAGHFGGGLYVAGGAGPHVVNVTNSTVNDNAISSGGSGGAIYVDGMAAGTLSLLNSTLSGNTAAAGSAIHFAHAALTIRSCTFTANNASGSAADSSIFDAGNVGMVVKNTILSGNIAGGGFRDLGASQLATGNNNLIGLGGPFPNGTNGNIVGVTNPRLDPININGGTSTIIAFQPLTFALQPDSPAIDAGSNADVASIPTDQRGQPRSADGDNNGTAVTDIGAFETQRYLVTTTADTGSGSLRQAILSNNTAGGGFVKFAIPTLGQIKTISPVGALPIISRIAFIDGWSQGGQTYQGPPLIEIEGSLAPNSIGLDIQWSDCILRGLSINNFRGTGGLGVGVRIDTSMGLRNWIYGDYIGVRPDGVTARGNGQLGIWIRPTANSNIIGTNADNVRDALERNVISGSAQDNLRTGVYIESNSNIVAGNNIGTDVTGMVAIPNFNGVWVRTGSSNQIGTSAVSQNPAAERNIIAGNINVGISFTSQGSNNFVSGNYIGLNASGNAALPNVLGVYLVDVNRTLVGGTSPGERNIISGNLQQGVIVAGTNAYSNLLQGNYIGTNAVGTGAIPNAFDGVLVREGATFTRIGAFGDGSSLETARRNVISGNGGPGVTIQDAATNDNRVMGDYIGVAADGVAHLGNMFAGVLIMNSPNNQVGAPGTGRNIIGAGVNMLAGNGVTIAGIDSVGNRVRNNMIGIAADGSAAGNSGAGVTIMDSAAANAIGGTAAGEGNTIANNGASGVRVINIDTQADSILGNSIVSNSRLGIDLSDDGVTPNGPAAVVRVGPNALQNYPVLISATPGGQITATLAAKASTTFRIEYFSSVTADSSNFGEGRTFLGFRTVQTSAAGTVGPFSFTASLLPGETFITATATELAAAAGLVRGFPTLPGAPLGTSEFSMARAINTAPTTSNQVASTLEDTDVIITLLASDPDPSPVITFRVPTLPAFGQLLQFGTLAPLATGDTVADVQGRVVFRPAPNQFATPYTTFAFIANDGLADSVQSTATVNVAPVADTPSVTNSATQEDVQTTTGLVISRNPADGAEVTHFKITSISNGTLFQNNGSTSIVNGDFITFAQAASGLKFTPAVNFVGNGSFNVQASLSNASSGIGGATATATIAVSPVADTPSVTGTTTLEDTQSSTGLVISRNAVDGSEITHFRISALSTGQLFQNNGSTPIADGEFVSAAQASAGLKYTPPADFNGAATFNVQASLSATSAGIGGPPAVANITVVPVNDRPAFIAANPPTVIEDSGPAVVTGWVSSFIPGPANESTQTVLAYTVSGVTNTSLFAALPIVDSAGVLRYTPAPDASGTSEFTVAVRDNGGTTNGGIDTSLPQTFIITVIPVNDKPTFAAANPPATLEGTGGQSITTFISFFNPGPANESTQQLAQAIVDQVSNPSLFLVLPIVSNSGQLSYTPASSGFGTSTFRVRVRDDGGTSDGGVDTSDPQTFTIIIRPMAICHDVTIDARVNCVPLTVQPGQINLTPATPGPGATQTITFSRSLTTDFPFGITPVTVTATYSDGLVSSCVARVTVLATDCNANGIADACETTLGTLTDCNNDSIPDDCQCVWDDGLVFPTDAPAANGQLSHFGTIYTNKTADDFYLLPGRVYRLFEFKGQIITNTILHKAQLEFYEDCDGRPASTPFKTYTRSIIESEVPATPGYTMVTYSFDLCADCLFLDGGKTYWVSLIGITDAVDPNDASYWATTTPQANPAGMMGLAPMKREGPGGPPPYPVTLGPWSSAAVCCEGCANLAWKITGEPCTVAWDNGSIDLDTTSAAPTAGGSPSDSDTSIPFLPRTADNFIVTGCEPVQVCYLETYIWSNCNPVRGFAEIYDNDCKLPGLTPILTAPATRAELIPGATLIYNGQTLYGYKLVFCAPAGWTLAPNKNYWLAAGASGGSNAVGRTLFAYAKPDCNNPLCTQTRISTGRFLDHLILPWAWSNTHHEFAFKIAVRGSMGLINAQLTVHAPTCPTDINSDGHLDAQDIFDFLSAWFSGCP